MDLGLPILTDKLSEIFLLSVGSFLFAMLLTPIYTYIAYRFGFWKKQRTNATTGEKATVLNKLHADKFRRNIPTMAGTIFVVSVAIITLLFNLDRRETYIPLAAMIGGALVGLLDDIINIRGLGGGVAGLRSKTKFALITVIGLGLGWYFYSKLGYDIVHVPYVGELSIGWLMIPLFAFAVVAAGNAVNMTDGLDGLAGGLSTIAFGAYGIIAMLQGQFILAGFCFTLVGALFSYVWFNIYPARFFMGDVGSFALGTSLGVVAMLTNTFLLLPIIGFVFVFEAGSSVIQIFSKKVFKRKVFLSAPVHHHLEAIGWPETKVTMRFWVLGYMCAFVGVYVAITGGHI